MLVAQKIIDTCKAIVTMGDVCIRSNLPEMAEAFEKISFELLKNFVTTQNATLSNQLNTDEISLLKSGNCYLDNISSYPCSATKIQVIKKVRERMNNGLKEAKDLVEEYIRKIVRKEI